MATSGSYIHTYQNIINYICRQEEKKEKRERKEEKKERKKRKQEERKKGEREEEAFFFFPPLFQIWVDQELILHTTRGEGSFLLGYFLAWGHEKGIWLSLVCYC